MTYKTVADLLRLDEDMKMYAPASAYARIHDVLLRAANALVEAEAVQVRLADAMEWCSEIAEASEAVATNAQRARAGGE